MANQHGIEREEQLLEELGKLYANQLQDQTTALSRYGELLSFIPDHSDALAFAEHMQKLQGTIDR